MLLPFMNLLEISLVGLALAVDATLYAFSYGLVLRQQRRRAALQLALTVGLYQMLMPLPGYWGGSAVRELVAAWAPWVVLLVFGALGGNILVQAWCGSGEETVSGTPLGFAALMGVGVATSIDALAVGACMALGDFGGAAMEVPQLLAACALIGGITFICALVAFHSARLLHRLPVRWLETVAGLILIGLGVQNLWTSV